MFSFKPFNPLVFLLPVLFLTACPATEPPADFELSILNDSLEIVQGSSETLNVQVLRKGDFSEAIALTFTALPSGFSATPSAIAKGANSSQFELTSTATVGNYSLELIATSGSLSREASMTVNVLPEPAEVTELKLEGYEDSLQVRQGVGEVIMSVSGKNLADLSEVSLDDLSIVLEDASGSIARFSVSIPHGVNLGKRSLSFKAQGKTLELNNALEITAIRSAPSGDDTSGKGTPDQPFRSLTKALTVAESGDGISLASGEYSETSGESWTVWVHGNALPGLVENDGLQATIPAGVSISGEGAATVLKGNGVGSYTLGLVLSDGVNLTDLLLQDFEYAVLASSGSASLSNVRVNDSAAGLWAYGDSSVTVAGESEFSGSIMGAAALNTANLTLNDTKLSFGLFGLALSQDAKAVLDGVKAFSNVTGIAILDQADVRLNSVEANDNTIGMDLSGGVVRVRDSSFSDNKQFGIRVVEEVLKLDLGTASDQGKNRLQNNELFQFLDARPERALPDGIVIEMSETLLGDSSLAAGAYGGIFVGENKSLMISFKNNLVQIY